ncbi:PREDICTED: uncharacterized protein LOC108363647 isoform X2 [Rhagoletis zephyria]|nr:PREDICTED: uncharacterized protein LOC108363647 isoform X2 [Rhagoletis zephyria]XP_017472563.1 PREDICTED: uncharacterized protein LOC108363647 isoform X2 [Rhagoletis zephyria]
MEKRPSKYVKLTKTNVETQDENRCENCVWLEEIFETKIDKKFQEIKDSISKLHSFVTEELKNSTTHQNTVVMEALAEQNVLIKKLLIQDTENSTMSGTFPIKDDDTLKELDENIDESNTKSYVNMVKKIISSNLQKNIDLIFEPEFIYEYNTDGSHGKKRLKDFKLYKVVKDAVATLYGVEEAEEKIRRAIHLSKKRYLKKILISKRNQSDD